MNVWEPEKLDLPTLPGKKEAFDVNAALKKALIDVKASIEKPPTCLAFRNGSEQIGVASLGNISLVTGKAKSRKTFLVTMITAAVLNGEQEISQTIIGKLPEHKKGVIYFDTEQSAYHAQGAVKRALKLAGVDDAPHFTAYQLRDFKTEQRRLMVEAAMKLAGNTGLVVIDGIRDLVNDINNAEECNELVTDLLKWSTEYFCHISLVIHENKTSSTIRGHLGTELQNKAETVFKVEKVPGDDEASAVTPEMTRERPFEKFAIGFDEATRLPSVFLDYEFEEPKKQCGFSKPAKQPAKSIEQYTHSEHCDYLKRAFSISEKLNGADLKANITTLYPNIKKEDVRRNSLSFLLQNGYLQTNAGEGVSNANVRYWMGEKVKDETSPF